MGDAAAGASKAAMRCKGLPSLLLLLLLLLLPLPAPPEIGESPWSSGFSVHRKAMLTACAVPVRENGNAST